MTWRRILPVFLAAPLIASLALGVRGQAFDVTLETPRNVAYKTIDGQRFKGRLVRYQRDRFRVEDAAGQTRSVAWEDLDPAMAERVWKRLLRNDDALGWAHAGVVYQDLEVAHGLADARVRRSQLAFDTALRLDPSLESQVARWRGGGDTEEVDAETSAEPLASENNGQPAATADDDAADTPRPKGAELWEQLTPEAHAWRADAAVQWTRQHLDAVGIEYTTTETAHFVLFADTSLGRRDRDFTLGLLEKMYDDCLSMFALTPDDQVYAGKCTVVVIRRDKDFFAYEKQAYGRVTDTLGGVCHYRPNGDVQIVAHRSDDEWFFRKMLVHENVHGFVHRYRSKASIPLWMNEGLAEYIAHRIVPQSTVVEARRREAHGEMHKKTDVSVVFGRWPGTQWAYGLSYGLTDMMIDGDRLAYRQLVHDIKDGVPWVDALQNNLRVDPAGLVSLYCRVHGLPDPGS